MDKYNNFSETVHSGTEESGILEAYKMSLLDYTKNDIIRILSEDNDEIKPIAIINIKSLDNKSEAELLLNHLTEQDGRIREAVSCALIDASSDCGYFTDEKSRQILTKAILDINPNVVRNVITFIENNEPLKTTLTPNIVEKTRQVTEELSVFVKGPFRENKEKSSKNHAKNKLTFNLYWLLSAISILDVNKIENLQDILTKTANFLDYTIREKTALILSKMDNPPQELLQKLKNDENIYVKNQLL